MIAAPEAAEAPRRLTDPEKVRILRNSIHAFIKALAVRDLEGAMSCLAEGSLPKEEVEKKMQEYHAARSRMRTDPEARATKHTHVKKEEGTWLVDQVLVDPAEANDWQMKFSAVFPGDSEVPALTLLSIGTI
jgi:hypothetical protein